MEPATGGEAPADSKGVELLAIGGLVIQFAMKSEVLKSVVDATTAWLGRQQGRSVKLTLDGDTLEVTGVSSDEQRRLVDLWVARHADDGEPGGGRRIALVVATGSYSDATLALLRAPGRDAFGLAEVLRDDEIGGFSVETVLDAPADVLRRRVARFRAQGAPGDLALVYLSCHGVLDDRGRLYYATTDTDRALLSATAIPAAWLNEQLEDCRCRRQILMLDCCHSGAFAKGTKGEGGLALRERFEGRGRVVLTASRGTEYSFEGGEVHGDGVSSVFTGVLSTACAAATPTATATGW